MMISHASTSAYYQGRNLLKTLSKYVRRHGKVFAVLADEAVFSILKETLQDAFSCGEVTYETLIFSGEATADEASRLAVLAEEKGCDGLIGMGGGKVIDTAKAVADQLECPLIVVPTAASSDAPCSALSVVYNEEGDFICSQKMKKHPDCVIADTEVIRRAPIRTFIAGVGDAFATYYEARACRQSKAVNFTGGVASETAYGMAKLCKALLFGYSVQAIEDIQKDRWSEAIEKVVEANIYLSGVGFENNGCAIAHAIYSGLTAVIKPLNAMHGEAVAYGTLVQLAAEHLAGSEEKELCDAAAFFQLVGLPLSLKDLGLSSVSDSITLDIAQAACSVSKNAHNMPFEVSPNLLYQAMARCEEMANERNTND